MDIKELDDKMQPMIEEYKKRGRRLTIITLVVIIILAIFAVKAYMWVGG